MSDFCTYCGDQKASYSTGKYIALTDDENLGLFTEVFLCIECEREKRT